MSVVSNAFKGSKFTVQGCLSFVEPGIYVLKLNIRHVLLNRCHVELTLHFGARLFGTHESTVQICGKATTPEP